MKVKFWGVRGSLPAPQLPRDIEQKIKTVLMAATPQDIENEETVDAFLASLPFFMRSTYGGNSPCVQVTPADGKLMIVDAGSGIRELGLDLLGTPAGRGQGDVHLFLSHTHWDHIQGFPFFPPAYIPGNKLTVYNDKDLRKTFSDQQDARYFPVPLEYMRSKMTFEKIRVGETFQVGETEVCTLEMFHPGMSLAFRFVDKDTTFIYASDSEFNMRPRSEIEEFIEFVRDADGLVFDSHFTFTDSQEKITWGHSSAEIGIDIAVAANVKRLFLFHHEPSYNDEKLSKLGARATRYKELIAAESNLQIITTYDGLELDL